MEINVFFGVFVAFTLSLHESINLFIFHVEKQARILSYCFFLRITTGNRHRSHSTR